MAILAPHGHHQVLNAPVTQVQGQGGLRRAVTRLSRAGRVSRKITGVFRLAWRSLLLVSMMLVAQSCIVADPPEYRAPGQTRPLLNVYSADPPATRALVVYTNTTPKVGVQFNIQVRSEDAGEDLRAIFFLDYQIDRIDPYQFGEDRLNSQTIPASTYDQTRTIRYTWYPSTSNGCHFLSLIVAHHNTFLQTDEDHLDPRLAADDAAIVTWTVSVNPTVDGTLTNCPSNDTTQP